MFSEGVCSTCKDETEREEGDSNRTTAWARRHARRNPTHTVYVEQGRLLVYDPTEATHPRSA